MKQKKYIRVKCPKCGQGWNEKVNKKKYIRVKCPKCGQGWIEKSK